MKKNLLKRSFLLSLCVVCSTLSFGQTKADDVNGIDPGILPAPKSAEIYTFVEQPPESSVDVSAYFLKKLHCSAGDNKSAVNGRVIVQFVVNEDGTLSDYKLLRGLGGCDEEIKKAVMSMPKWKPGKQNGKPVKVRYSLPINLHFE